MNTVSPTINTNIPVLGDPTNRKIVNLTDGDSNQVYRVNGRYIYKEYFSSEQLNYETTGCLVFNLLSSYGIPMLLDKGPNYLVTEYIDSTSCLMLYRQGQLSKTEIGRKASTFLSEVYWNYRYFNRSKVALFQNIAWKDRFIAILNYTQAHYQDWNIHLDAGDLRQIGDILTRLSCIYIPPQSLTFLHRDLHLDNVLIQEKKSGRDSNFFIDFEHCMEGPIEFELQNSIFWDDEWSLPVNFVRDELIKVHDIPYSIELEKQLLGLYYVDQLNLAYSKLDYTKMNILADRFRSFYAPS
ncbi:phosphotransferase [candidate division WWE3 bacterium]|nr:phosphotransferase [candidate division WWE3 bacterium]